MEEYLANHGGTTTPDEFRYSSGKNDQWLTVEEIRQLIVTHVDPSFSV